MKHLLIAGLILFFTGVPSSFAQSRANFAWWNSPLRDDLNLTDAQKEKIRQIVHSYRPKLLDARNNVQKAEGDLDDVMNEDRVDPAAAKPVIDRVASARAESSRVLTEMSVRLRAVLTIDQWRTLVKRQVESQQRKNPPDTQVNP